MHVKCLVWDLDNTLWDGILLEGDEPVPFTAAVRTLRALDERGVLHAVASRSDAEQAAGHLRRHGLIDFFTVVEVGWGAKSAAVARIAQTLDIGVETLAFVDDDPVERAEVAGELPMVRCYPAGEAGALPDRPEFQPPFITAESRQRRLLYRAARLRVQAEQEFAGSSAQFLTSLELVMTIRRATEDDLARAHELTVRTHQLNTTGLTFGMAELRALCESPDHEVLVARLTDRFGDYGTIGIAVTDLSTTDAVLKLLLMSCRVLSRGVGSVLVEHVVQRALRAGRRPVAEFVPTGVNRAMLVTFRFGGFEVVREDAERLVLAVDPGRPRPPGPGHVTVLAEDPV
ncbi:HAD-IIIC family phosphatase [Actinokineospora sp. NBRC 105648]|uniref:HAD-IIIC family phosphatase n=1 Tax=Actinokineospora sp. NBRC 105648 TaxID=3032206 RepID=UPI0024A4FECF|nr:HAD-IIIC family phosphatase [Actinokineospora sp. NBRC 105648]GLZ40298.1 haloacid dehalogenase [Actinokineospora sp. NBRC 105648]